MPYLANAANDVFLSYAHVDNIPDREGEKGWVERFDRQLSVRLLKRFGEAVEVWRDPELKRSQKFDPVIESAVRGAGIVVSIVTNRYLRSDYCEQELDWFKEEAENGPTGLEVDNHVRVFPILLYNIPPEEWPSVCKGTSAFKFHDGDGDQFGRPLDPDSDEFETELRQLVEEIYSVLTKLQEMESGGSETGSGAESASSDASFRVFMGCPADDLRRTWTQLTEALEEEGIEVVPGFPHSYNVSKHTETVKHAVEEADLCVHLLGPGAGEPLEEGSTDRTFPLEQLQLGLDNAQSQLLLMPEGLDVDRLEVDSYSDLMHELKEKKRKRDRLELVTVGRRQMLEQILNKRQALEEKRQSSQEASEDGQRLAFIDMHSSDFAHVPELVVFLNERKLTPTMVTPDGGLAEFEEKLGEASLYLVGFGSVDRAWVVNRLIQAVQLKALHKLRRLRIGIYVAPPEKPAEELDFADLFNDLTVALNTEGFDPATLGPLLNKATGESS